MTLFQSLPTEISTYNQWCRSEGCTKVKEGGVTIVAALSAIALIVGTLLILAQQGYPLGGINTIAKMVESKWVYLGMGSAAILLTLDIALIIAQIRSYQNQTFPDKEVQQLQSLLDAPPDPELRKAESFYRVRCVGKVLEEKEDYMVYEFDSSSYVFFREGDEMKSDLVPKAQLAGFLRLHGLTRDAGAELEKSDRYPPALGYYLLTILKDREWGVFIKKMVSEKGYILSDGEFISFEEGEAEHSVYSTVAVLAVYRDQRYYVIFFKNKEAREKYLQIVPLNNGFSRDSQQLEYAEIAGRAITEAQPETDRKPLFFRFDYPDGTTVCFITYHPNRELKKFYHPSSEADAKFQELSANLLFVDTTKPRALTNSERKFLEQKFTEKGDNDKSIADTVFNELDQRDYRVRQTATFYRTLFIRHQDEKGERKQEILYYCTQDPTYRAKINELDEARHGVGK